MTTRPHLDEEILAAHLLGAVEEAEADEVARHLETCSECRERLAEVNSLLALLPESIDDLTPPSGVKAGLLERLGDTDQPSSLKRTEPVVAIHPKQRGLIQVPILALAASILVAAILGAVAGGLITRGSDTNQGLLQAITGYSDGIVLPMDGTAVAPDVRAALLAPTGIDRVYVVASNVPPPPAGQAYNLYLYQDGTPVHAATLQPDARGRVSAVLDAPLSRFDAMEVDIQPIGTTTPGGPAVLKSNLP